MNKNNFFVKVASPYADALFSLSQSMQSIDQTSKHLDFVIKSIDKSVRLKNFLVNPLFPAQAKKNVLSRLFIDQVDAHLLSFLHVLVDRGRIFLLRSVAQCYFDLVYKLQLVLLVEVSTAVALTASQKQALQNKLKLMTSSKEIQLIECINPELIGGLVIKIGSKVIDMSIYGQLNQISFYLNGARL